MIEIIPKIKVEDRKTMALVYTPGVAESSLEIKNNPDRVFDLTNRSNSLSVISNDYQTSLKRAQYIHDQTGADVYPLVVNTNNVEEIKFIVENIEPNFVGIDLCQLNIEEFQAKIPVLFDENIDVKEFFSVQSKNCFLKDFKDIEAIKLRELFGGVIEVGYENEKNIKPVAIISDGSAVLGLGNIGALAAIPVMEGKSVLFKELGNVSAIPLCIKTQETREIIKLAELLEGSFSGINLEDICAPKCFEIEQTLIEKLSIPVFHDDQHGAAIVVLAGLLNSLLLLNKELNEIRIVISGAGAAGLSCARLLLEAGAQNIILVDKDGIVFKGRRQNSQYLEEIALYTNKNDIKGGLKEAIIGADVFIGLSAGGILKPQMVKEMNKNPIIFALANPIPEIMPEVALGAGASIVATGRSDFNNQLNNSLVFPGIFKGAIENGVKKITSQMKINVACTIAACVESGQLSKEMIVPDPLDKSVALKVAGCVS